MALAEEAKEQVVVISKLSEPAGALLRRIGSVVASLHNVQGGHAIVWLLVISSAWAWWHVIFTHHYQVDFSAYWNSGFAVIANESPYSFQEDFRHSQFLYPPLIANLFSPLAFLNYGNAKAIWYFIQVLCLAHSLVLLMDDRLIGPLIALALFLLLPFFGWPLYAHFERGQIDLVALWCMAAAYRLQTRNCNFSAGLVLSAAGFLKLPAFALFLVPIVHRDQRFVYGGVCGVLALVAFSLAVNGSEINRLYWFDYLPVIAKTGVLPPHVFDLRETPSLDKITWDGQTYWTAQDVSVVTSLTAFTGYWFPGAILFGITICLLVRLGPSAEAWLCVIVTVLLSHRMTWLMGWVWVLFVVATGLRTSFVALVGTLAIGMGGDWPLGRYRILAGAAMLFVSIGQVALRSKHLPSRGYLRTLGG